MIYLFDYGMGCWSDYYATTLDELKSIMEKWYDEEGKQVSDVVFNEDKLTIDHKLHYWDGFKDVVEQRVSYYHKVNKI